MAAAKHWLCWIFGHRYVNYPVAATAARDTSNWLFCTRCGQWVVVQFESKAPGVWH